MQAIRVHLPLCAEDIERLRAGDEALISGVAYMARDAAHRRLMALIQKGEPLPIDLCGACVYYAGPCPGAPGEVIGPCGPTTSGRMDAYTPRLIDLGLTAMIGKGRRAEEVKQAMKGRAVYFAATGGAGMLIAQCITEADIAAFDELGPEAVYRIRFKDLPAVVAVDAHGGDVFDHGEA